MNIPSNYTLEEVLKYYPSRIPEELLVRIENSVKELNGLRAEVEAGDKVEEILQEQIDFRDEFIRNTLKRCRGATKCKDLVESILVEFADSYIEL